MKKFLLSTLVLMTLAACGGKSDSSAAQSTNEPASTASAGSLKATDTLNIYNWSNYVDENTVEDFRKNNQLKVRYDTYENNETLEAKMLTGKSGYDLGVPGIAILPRQI